MLKQIPLTLGLLLLSFQAPDLITSIQRKYQTLNATQKTFGQITKNEDGISSEGAAIDAFYDSTGFRIIVESIYNEMSRHKTSLYFDPNNQLIFVYDALIVYPVPMYDSTFNMKDTRTVASRFYFNQRKLLKWLGEKAKDSTTKQYHDQQAAWLDYSDDLVKQMTRYYAKNLPAQRRYLPIAAE